MSTKHRHRIRHQDEIGAYIPPDHQGTVNIRLVEKDFCGAFEMNLGTVQPGGEAEPHLHETEHQVVYVMAGSCEVTLGDDSPVACQTNATAQSAGWIWDIGLSSRRGVGHVYSSSHTSDEAAEQALQAAQRQH